MIPSVFSILFLAQVGRSADNLTQPAPAEPATTGNSYKQSITSALNAGKEKIVGLEKELVTASNEMLKSIGRFSLLAADAVVGVINGVSLMSAKTGKAVAHGWQKLNGPIASVPLIGTATTGVEHAMVGMTNTFDENSKFANKNRAVLITSWRERLNNYQPRAGTTTTSNGGDEANPEKASSSADPSP